VTSRTGAIGIKQAVEGTPQAIIAQVLHLLGRDAEHTGGEAIYLSCWR
jgi:hypothetical protein